MTKADSEGLIAKKAANALIKDAQLVDVLKFGFAALSKAGGGKDPIDLVRSAYGGLWVGGGALLFRDRVEFRPNLANRLVHRGDTSLRIKLSDIDKVESRFGLVSGIIDLHCGRTIVSLRTFGAKAFAKQIDGARAAA